MTSMLLFIIYISLVSDVSLLSKDIYTQPNTSTQERVIIKGWTLKIQLLSSLAAQVYFSDERSNYYDDK